ncbi:MAG TPA: hypothetical protein VFN67_01050 [Polyangiales bacterium]|nr:hypothetical protein [Polyangiales bacterium]
MRQGNESVAADNAPHHVRHVPRSAPKPEFASFWQLLRTRPSEGLRWLVFGGEHARFFNSPVRWLFGRDLLVSMRSIALYSAFGDELDHRDWMEPELNDLSELPCEEGAFWFDFIADTGDGQLAMYNIASLVLSDLYVSEDSSITLSPQPNSTRLPRGRFLFFGGDTAYHVADTATLEKHLCAPFAWALSEKEQRTNAKTSDPFYAFGIPGNHDYYDSLIGFNRLFRSPGSPHLPLADYQRTQQASFVALRLPFDYLFLGLDSQKGKLDRRQRSFMRRCLNEQGRDRLIIATPEPTTVFDSIEHNSTQAFADLRLQRPFCEKTAGFPHPEQLHLDLSGDVHHYARYADPEHPNYASVVAGGGGAFVHPTHTSHFEADEPWPPRAARLYPTPDDSRRLMASRLLCPWRILRGGGVFLLGGIFALLVYLGVALSPDLQQHWVLEEAKSAEDVGSVPGSKWEVDSPVAQNLGRVLDRDGGAQPYRAELYGAEWLTLLTLLILIIWAGIQSPQLFSLASSREETRRERVYVTRYAPLCAAALLSLSVMGATYYLVSREDAHPLRPFLANFLLFAYLLPFPLALFWVVNYLASQAKQAKVRLMHALDSAPRWIALMYGVGSAVFGLLSYGVNSVAAFATDLCALSAVLLLAVAPMVAAYQQGHGRSLRKKLGYLGLGALFGQLQLWLPLAIATYGSAWTLLISACAAVALATATYLVHRKWSSPWLMLGMWLLAGAASTLLALCTPALRSVNGTSAALAFAAGGSFACIWFGYYLAVCMTFGAHNNEAGGAACADHYRHFVRIKLERDRITGFVIGFDRPARDVDSAAVASQSETLRAHLVERFCLTVKSGRQTL